MPLVSTRLGSLRCRVFQHEEGPPSLAVVLCHGFGAPGEDLVPLAPELAAGTPALAHVRFVMPEAPLDLADMGMWGARAWWHLDMRRLAALEAGAADVSDLLRQDVPEELPTARKLLRALVDELLRETGLPYSKLVLGGFSQGGMLATDVALRLEEAPAALCVFSGALINEADWRARAAARRGLRVLQSHGRQDPLLPFENASALRELLTSAGLDVEFLAFDGPHTIPVTALRAARSLLEKVCSGAAG